MIHEGPLLEYAGRDLAYLQWAAAARHWLVLVLAAQVFLPHPHGVWSQLAVLPVALAVLCAALALVETLVAKMRVLLVPRLLAVGVGCGAARNRRSARGKRMSDAGSPVDARRAWAGASSVVRRRSLAVALVTAQALVLVGVALDEAKTSGDVLAAGALAVRAVILAALFLLLVARTALRARPVRARSSRSCAPASLSRSL